MNQHAHDLMMLHEAGRVRAVCMHPGCDWRGEQSSADMADRTSSVLAIVAARAAGVEHSRRHGSSS